MIVKKLEGDNPSKEVIIVFHEHCISQNRELNDMWGTPYLIRIVPRKEMEIRSAGRDKNFGTEDDDFIIAPLNR